MVAFNMSTSASCATSKIVGTFLSRSTTLAGRHGFNGDPGVVTSFVSSVLLRKAQIARFGHASVSIHLTI